MTISASEETDGAPERSLPFDLYEDLSVALARRIRTLDGTGETGPAYRDCLDALRLHQTALQTLLVIGASLDKQTESGSVGVDELDLDAARAEITARLAVWGTEG